MAPPARLLQLRLRVRCLVTMVFAVWMVGCQATIGDPSGVDENAPRADAAPDPGDPGDPGAADPDAAAPPPGPADAGAPDASPQARCIERYGAVPGFELCVATDTDCTFIAINGDVSCAAHCQPVGGLCLSALDNEVGECFELENDPTATCDTTGKIDLLCTCTL